MPSHCVESNSKCKLELILHLSLDFTPIINIFVIRCFWVNLAIKSEISLTLEQILLLVIKINSVYTGKNVRE